MSSHRSLRVAEAIREVVASAILFEAADPRIRAVTVLRVEVASDLRQATVFVSVMGSESERKLTMRGLKHASGFFQSRVADRLQIRFTPVLTFELDESVRKSVEMSRLIDEALASDRRAAAPGDDEDEEIVDEEEADEDLDDDDGDGDRADDSDVGLPR